MDQCQHVFSNVEDLGWHIWEFSDQNESAGLGGPITYSTLFFVSKTYIYYLFDVFNIFCVQSSVKEFESIGEDYMKCRDIWFIHVENIFNKSLYQATEAP